MAATTQVDPAYVTDSLIAGDIDAYLLKHQQLSLIHMEMCIRDRCLTIPDPFRRCDLCNRKPDHRHPLDSWNDRPAVWRGQSDQ